MRPLDYGYGTGGRCEEEKGLKVRLNHGLLLKHVLC